MIVVAVAVGAVFAAVVDRAVLSFLQSSGACCSGHADGSSAAGLVDETAGPADEAGQGRRGGVGCGAGAP